MTANPTRPASPLASTKVLDLGRYVAAPYCATLLGDLGADVIRVERPGGGDDRVLGSVAAEDTGATFLAVNRNKRDLTLDFTKPEGLEVLYKLVAESDVVIANMPLPVLDKLKIGYAHLREIRPDVIFTTVDTFGPGGPYSDNAGFDGIAQVMSGAAYMSGLPGRPAKASPAWVDYLTATTAAVATLGALRWRDQTGQGQHVHASLLASALTASGGFLVEQAANQSDWEPVGNRTHVSPLADICATKDGAIIVQLAGESLFRRWVNLMGDPEWLDDPRFASEAGRRENAEPLVARLNEWCAAHSTQDAIALLRDVGIPSGPVYSPQQVLDDEHVIATDALPHVAYPGVPLTTRVPRSPIQLSETPPTMRTPPPTVGQHTTEILREAGYGDSAIQDLRDHGIC